MSHLYLPGEGSRQWNIKGKGIEATLFGLFKEYQGVVGVVIAKRVMGKVVGDEAPEVAGGTEWCWKAQAMQDLECESRSVQATDQVWSGS